MSKKQIKFSESILGQMGWTETEYNEFMYWHCQFLMSHNIRMTPQITRDYVNDYTETHHKLWLLGKENEQQRGYANDD